MSEVETANNSIQEENIPNEKVTTKGRKSRGGSHKTSDVDIITSKVDSPEMEGRRITRSAAKGTPPVATPPPQKKERKSSTTPSSGKGRGRPKKNSTPAQNDESTKETVTISESNDVAANETDDKPHKTDEIKENSASSKADEKDKTDDVKDTPADKKNAEKSTENGDDKQMDVDTTVKKSSEEPTPAVEKEAAVTTNSISKQSEEKTSSSDTADKKE